jgi:hypothetical protein
VERCQRDKNRQALLLMKTFLSPEDDVGASLAADDGTFEIGRPTGIGPCAG